jgi:archaellum biogenesis protein FlaJ (TadC family)
VSDGPIAADGVAEEGSFLAEARSATSLSVVDRALYALFARHADGRRHARDRRRYRGTDLGIGFDLYLARVYGLSWAAALLITALVAAVVAATPVSERAAAALATRLGRPVPPWIPAVVGVVVTAAVAKAVVVQFGGLVLRWRAAGRRHGIERTLPGAVRYLHVLASGSDDPATMLRKVAETDAHGESAAAFRAALNRANLQGSLGDGLARIARDTPSRELLAPFLLKFREHANQGESELSDYLRMESRMLAHRQSRSRQRAEGFLELLAEMFMVLLVFPALLVIVLTVMTIVAPGLSATVATPVGSTTIRGVVIYASAGFVLGVGAGASVLVAGLRPSDQSVTYDRPSGLVPTVATTLYNPASASVVLAVPAAVVGVVLWTQGFGRVDSALLAYVAYGVPVGAVAVARARRDDAKDREMTDFVHAVSGHVNLGRPFPEAVELVAREVDLGPLNAHVADLALNMRLTTPERDGEARDHRAAALDRFVDRVGTPLAAQSVGLVTGALDGGSEPSAVFDTLQTEIGRLYHRKRELRSNMLVYVAVGWTTALLVVGITVAVGIHVFDGFAQLSAVSGQLGHVLDPTGVALPRARFRLYVVTQATMLAAGWFAGTASRGRHEALLHSGVLVLVCHVVYAGVGML